VNLEWGYRMEIVKLIDYAPHLLEVKHLTLELHRLLIENDFEEANHTVTALVVETKLLASAVYVQGERNQ
jgi:hypothetical protein